MSFSIRHVKQQELELIAIADETTGTEVTLLPGFGATLQAFHVRQKDGSLFNVIDSYKNAAELKSELSRSFKGPKLSPFPCRIPDGIYHFGEKEYQFGHLFPDGTAIHGLLYDKPFAVLEEATDAGEGMILLEYGYRGEDPGYPFDYNCQVRYILRSAGDLEVATTVTNLDKRVIPIADGWHPYFRLGGKCDHWKMQFHSAAMLEFDARLVPTGRLIQYDAFDTARLLGDTFLDNCFALKPEIVSAACELYNHATGIRVAFFPDAAYPYLQIYTPPHRDSIAIENLSGAPNCFNNKMGLLLLQPGHSQIFTLRYKVSVE
jgi:aldose 1-epimerase